MSYPEVIQLIDVELRRLLAAREFLLAPAEGEDEEAASDSPSGVADIQAMVDEVVPPVVKRLKPKERRATRTRREAPPETTALSGPVPHRPVYVAATQVRDQQAQRGGGDGAGAAPETLTAEMLHQKWFSNTAG